MRYDHAGGAKRATLQQAMNDVAVEASLDLATGWPTGGVGPFFAVIDRGETTEEKVLVTSRSGTTLTIQTRGADGTTPQSHAAGATVEHVFSATEADASNAHYEATDGVHGLAGGQMVASTAYVDQAEVDAKAYADTQDATQSTADRAYTDAQDAAQSTADRAYTDSEIATQSTADRAYTDSEVATVQAAADAAQSSADAAQSSADAAQASADAAQADFDGSLLVQSGQGALVWNNNSLSEPEQITFPIEFASAPVSVVCVATNTYRNMQVNGVNTTGFQARGRTVTDNAATDPGMPYYWIAVGPRP